MLLNFSCFVLRNTFIRPSMMHLWIESEMNDYREMNYKPTWIWLIIKWSSSTLSDKDIPWWSQWIDGLGNPYAEQFNNTLVLINAEIFICEFESLKIGGTEKIDSIDQNYTVLLENSSSLWYISYVPATVISKCKSAWPARFSAIHE